MQTIIEVNHTNYTERVIITEENKGQAAATFKGMDVTIVQEGDVEFKPYILIDGMFIRPTEANETLLCKLNTKKYHTPMIAEIDHLKKYENNIGTYVNFQGERYYIYETV